MLYLLRYLSLRYWLRHRGGLALAVLGVALGIAVFVAIQVANHSVLAAFETSLDSISGRANLQIVGGRNGLSDEFYTRLRARQDPRIQAMAPLLTKTLYCPTLHTTLLLMGVDLFAEADFRSWDNSPMQPSGNHGAGLARLVTDPHAMAIGASLANRFALHRGSRLMFYVGARRVWFRVCEILDGRAQGRAFGGDFGLLDIASAQEAFQCVGRLSQIDLLVDENEVDAVASQLRRLAPPDALVQRPAMRGQEVADMLSAFQINLTALACISLFVGAFLIYNSIAIAVVRRRPEVGILRAVGTSGNSLTGLFLIEAAILGLLGSLCGMALGLGLARFALKAVGTTVSALYVAVKAGELVVPPWLWWGAPLGGTVLCVASAIPAACEAANIPPRAALQTVTLHHATGRYAMPMGAAGVVCLALALPLCLPAVLARTSFAGFAAALCTLCGFALCCPAATLLGARLARRLAALSGDIEANLASIYLQRALNRSSLTIAALMVSLSLVIGMTVMVASFRSTVMDWVDGNINADLYVTPATGFEGERGPGLPPEVVRFAAHLPGVAFHDSVRGVNIELRGRPVFIAANTLQSLQRGARHMRFVSTVAGADAARQAFGGGQAVLVSERFANMLHYGAGGSLALPTPRGTIEFRIAGVFHDYTPNACVVYLPRVLYIKYWGDTAIDALGLYLSPGASVDALARAIDRRFGREYQLTLLSHRDIRARVLNTFDQTFAVTYALELIAVLIAVIGVFDTLTALLLERGHELAILRALGAGEGQIRKIMSIELGLIGLFAWIVGTACGLCLAWELILVINRQFFGWTIQWLLPPLLPGETLLLAVLASVGAGVIPITAALARRVAEALRSE